jgi:arginase family enzyme
MRDRARACGAHAARRCHVHLDLDVLDPSDFRT